MTPNETLTLLKSTTGFIAMGDPVGNVTLGRGAVNGRAVFVALVENKIASGSMGAKECDKLASMFRVVAAQKTPLYLYMDSAGARVSEGLPALGAFRHMFRAALDMALALAASDATFTVLLGTNCYGGASMLAALANTRVFSGRTQLAMSGPTILATAAGASSLDESFRAIAEVAIGANGRTKLSASNVLALDVNSATKPLAWYQRHQQLGEHPVVAATLASAKEESLQRNDLAALYPMAYEATECTYNSGKLIFGKAKDDAGKIRLLGIADQRLLGAGRAWVLADRIWELAAKSPERLHIVVDCESHSAQLDDERAMLSAYLVDLSLALLSLARAGTVIETTVLGCIGGGVYVTLAAASHKLNLLHGANIQLLPSKAVASILGDAEIADYTIADYMNARVADDELRVGFLRT